MCMVYHLIFLFSSSRLLTTILLLQQLRVSFFNSWCHSWCHPLLLGCHFLNLEYHSLHFGCHSEFSVHFFCFCLLYWAVHLFCLHFCYNIHHLHNLAYHFHCFGIHIIVLPFYSIKNGKCEMITLFWFGLCENAG